MSDWREEKYIETEPPKPVKMVVQRGWMSTLDEQPTEDGLYQVVVRNWVPPAPWMRGTEFDHSDQKFCLSTMRFKDGKWQIFVFGGREADYNHPDYPVAFNPVRLLELKGWEDAS